VQQAEEKEGERRGETTNASIPFLTCTLERRRWEPSTAYREEKKRGEGEEGNSTHTEFKLLKSLYVPRNEKEVTTGSVKLKTRDREKKGKKERI